jgi:protein-S-isoprenylcysteine O-methyltransferase Ste14/pimeloyl-ACP methyl ester carboxylesterase
MKTLVTRAILAFLALPGVVAFAIPLTLLWPSVRTDPPRLAGLLPFGAGVALLLWATRDFLVRGRGTLAPWDPPRTLVVSGPYRYSRNPMYVAVVGILVGWSLAYRSFTLATYALVVMVLFHLRVVLAEEPFLARTQRDEWARYRSRAPRWIFPSRRAVLLTFATALIALPLGGIIYEAYADARGTRDFPPPGELVDIGEGRLHLVCIGEGAPIVMFEQASFSNSLSYSQARERIARRTRVCSYDRFGMGWSDAGPAELTTAMLAQQLAVLQDRARLPQPFVLVTSSIGGLTTEMFARRYPERVAGLVFVDAATSDLFATADEWLPTVRRAACAAAFAARFGLVRLIDPFGLGDESSDAARRSAAITYGARPLATICALARGFSAGPGDFAQAPPLSPTVPLIVLTAEQPQLLLGIDRLDRAWAATRLGAHKALASRSANGSWRQVPKSTHLIADSQPDAVVDAVFEMLDSSSAGTIVTSTP